VLEVVGGLGEQRDDLRLVESVQDGLEPMLPQVGGETRINRSVGAAAASGLDVLRGGV
jgi:hypothetical protein